MFIQDKSSEEIIRIPGRTGSVLVSSEYKALVSMLQKHTWKRIGNINLKTFNGHLIELGIEAANLKVIPEEICEFKFLEILNLGYNDIEKIENLGGLSHLRVLDLMVNSIRKLEGLDSLVNLEKLYLFFNFIEKIENLCNLRKLRLLDLNSNMISRIENLENLVELQGLYLHDNQLDKIEGLENLTELKELTLRSRFQPFRCFVPKIGFHTNHISRLENIKHLGKLQILDASNNLISEAENLSGMTSLELLDLEFNELKVMPAGIENIKSVKLKGNPCAEVV